ncbi:MAG: class I SAM-dependent methyltransferase, partial [Acidimicrobiales bacterium]|nr:class I SAM-dependent methyltransferase [Acidimicrobiales bacterium]
MNWDARLARELPFFERIFAQTRVSSLIDVGAGSARHAIAFAEQGMAVDAVDPDDSMLAQAETNIADATERIAAGGGELRLLRGGFGELAGLGLGGADA